MMQNMYQDKESDLPNFKYLRREVMKVQNYCLNCKNRLSPLCMIINTGNYHSEVQLKTQVGKFPVYCLRCVHREVKNTFIISLDSDSETEKENRIPDNETEFQTGLNTENVLPHVAVSNETADKENLAVPTALQESSSTLATSTELQVSALNANNESEFQTGLNTENVLPHVAVSNETADKENSAIPTALQESSSTLATSTELQVSALNADNESEFQTSLNTENVLPHVAVSNETADKENLAVPTALQESSSTLATSTELQVSALNADNESEFQTGLNTENVLPHVAVSNETADKENLAVPTALQESSSTLATSTELQVSALNADNEREFQTGLNTENVLPHVAVSNETADKKNSAIPTALQESSSTLATSTELQVSALNADNESEYQTGLNTENVLPHVAVSNETADKENSAIPTALQESPSTATISTELQESALNDTKVTPRRSGRKTKQTPPLLYYYRILEDSPKRKKLSK
ncbi:uncharacterized protein LOC109600515 isoform X3 [Aethina tumida]|uniref:uncharacterized protein LOC109600515 isoform X3 n=1 Tax=Aethina tumida TaxID=116153 RepID=UPI0021483EEE|nr:uncharacterized protein LOC109600515 isoform X3 [Aethina tumida]XP_049817419.1 uncharacterized protein LOC109600515 isoform X3 [Aethina tumida]